MQGGRRGPRDTRLEGHSYISHNNIVPRDTRSGGHACIGHNYRTEGYQVGDVTRSVVKGVSSILKPEDEQRLLQPDEAGLCGPVCGHVLRHVLYCHALQ